MTTVPVDSRTTVQGVTQEGLTLGSEWDQVNSTAMTVLPTPFDSILETTLRVVANLYWHDLVDEGHSLVRMQYVKNRCSTISAAGLNTSPKLRAYIRSLSPRLLRVV